MKKLAVFFCSLAFALSVASMVGATPVTWDGNGAIKDFRQGTPVANDLSTTGLYAPIDLDYYTGNILKDPNLISLEMYGLNAEGIGFNNSFLDQTDIFSWLCRIWPFICAGWEWPSDWPNWPPNGGDSSNPTPPVPEPATMLLLGTGLICLAGLGRKKFFKQ